MSHLENTQKPRGHLYLICALAHGLAIGGSGSPGFYAAVLVKDERVTLHRGDTAFLEAAPR
jgi:hypothetical protein